MIVVPALHPAHDLIVRLDTFAVGAVHRAATGAIAVGVGGKSVNVALAVARMGTPVRLIVLADDALLDALRAVGAGLPDLELIAIPSPVTSRTDLAIAAGEGLTVINSTAADPGPEAVARVHASTLHGLSEEDVLVLAGSTPAGAEAAHPVIATHAASNHVRVIVDSDGPALAALLATRPTVVKVAAAEAARLAGTAPIPDQRQSARAVRPSAPRPAGLASVPIVGVTDGAAGLRAWLPDGRAVRVLPPSDVRVISSLGAGDAVTAGLAIALSRGDDPIDGFILGSAMAASTLDHLDSSVEPSVVDAYRAEVCVIDLV
jgi:fructose-1-phosphate kinase PfkB-like protein